MVCDAPNEGGPKEGATGPKGPKERCPCVGCRVSVGTLSFGCRFCRRRFCARHCVPEEHGCDIRGSPAYAAYKAPPVPAVKRNPGTERTCGGVGA